jgi:hypothetical protein
MYANVKDTIHNYTKELGNYFNYSESLYNCSVAQHFHTYN